MIHEQKKREANKITSIFQKIGDFFVRVITFTPFLSLSFLFFIGFLAGIQLRHRGRKRRFVQAGKISQFSLIPASTDSQPKKKDASRKEQKENVITGEISADQRRKAIKQVHKEEKKKLFRPDF